MQERRQTGWEKVWTAQRGSKTSKPWEIISVDFVTGLPTEDT